VMMPDSSIFARSPVLKKPSLVNVPAFSSGDLELIHK
jgi:hypothetical protein